MSAFNTVVLPKAEICPRCGSCIRRRVQFKYGSRWSYDYAVGDRIKWGGNDYGIRAHRVKVIGYPEPCPVCDNDPDGVYDVIIRDDVIEDVVPGRSAPYLEKGDDGYLVLEP